MLINMLFKMKEKQPQKDEIAPPTEGTRTPMDDETPACTAPASEEVMATDNSKAMAKELNHTHPDIIYPSGIKLALLMTSIFVGMFLISLVRSRSASNSRLRAVD